MGASIACLGAARVEFSGARGADQTGAAPINRRGGHADLPERARAAGGDLQDTPRTDQRSGTRRPRCCGRGYASVLTLERSDSVSRRSLRQHRRRTSAVGAVAADLRAARPRRGAGQPDRDRYHERGQVFPAAPSRAVNQLAVLDGSGHRPQVVPHDDIPPVPAHRGARSLRFVERIRELHQAARRTALHRRCEEDLVGRPAASEFWHAGIPRL